MSVTLKCEHCGKEFDCGCGLLEIHTGTKGVCRECAPLLISEEDMK